MGGRWQCLRLWLSSVACADALRAAARPTALRNPEIAERSKAKVEELRHKARERRLEEAIGAEGDAAARAFGVQMAPAKPEGKNRHKIDRGLMSTIQPAGRDPVTTRPEDWGLN